MRPARAIDPRARILVLLGVITTAYFVLFGRLVYWQGVRHNDLARLAADYHDAVVPLPPVRGKIFDRYGALLVTNTPVFSVFASPDQIAPGDRARVADALAPVLGMDRESLVRRLSSTHKFTYLKRRVAPTIARELDRLQLPGIGKIEESQRTYTDGAVPGTTLAANLLGFTNYEGDGNYGVEGFYDRPLRGTPGFEATIRDLTNRPIVLSDRKRVEPVDGMSLHLTLDSRIQVVAERALAEGVKKYKGESGSLIIMEPRTGKIVAWAVVPSYDANQFATTATARFVDPGVSHLYEPGSVMKVVTLSGALDAKAITPDYRFYEPGYVDVGGYRIRNWDHRAHGSVTMSYVLENSLNVGAVKAEQLEGPQRFYQYLQRFGIGELTGIDLAGEVRSPLDDLSHWKDARFATATFGQGVAVTPIEMLAAINVIAAGGDLVWPHIVDATIDPHGVRHPVQPRVIRHVVSPTAAGQMQQMMVGVVEHPGASGFAARIDGFRGHVAGKTGTANIPENGGYSEDDVVASFVGFLPVENPQFTMMVVVHKPQVEPKIQREGAYVAAPIWKSVATAIITQWNIAPG